MLCHVMFGIFIRRTLLINTIYGNISSEFDTPRTKWLFDIFIDLLQWSLSD